MVRKHGPQTHCARMKYGFMAETAQAGVSVHNLNLFPDDNVSEHGKEGKDRGHGRLSVYNEEGHMVDLEAIGEIPHSGSSFVCMGNYDDFVATIDEFLDLVSNLALPFFQYGCPYC